MNKNIKLIRLATGEQVMANVVQTENDYVVVENPTLIVLIGSQQKNNPNPTVGLAPWMEFTEDKQITIDRRHIVAIMNPVKQFIEQYNKIHSNIITPPTSGLILPS